MPKRKLIENTNWFPIANDTIHKNKIREISPKTFSILCYLLAESRDMDYCRVTLGELKDYFEFTSLPALKKQISKLISFNYISLGEELKKIKRNHKIIIYVNYKNKALNNNGYEMIPIDLFYKKYQKIKHHGWSLLCALSVHYNPNWGYGCPKIDQLCQELGMSSDYVQMAIKILCENKLIKLFDKNDQLLCTVGNKGEVFYRYEVNKYVVKFMNNKIWFDYLVRLKRRKEEQRKIDDEDNSGNEWGEIRNIKNENIFGDYEIENDEYKFD